MFIQPPVTAPAAERIAAAEGAAGRASRRPRFAERRIASLCDLRYARARTHADTLVADRVDVGGKFGRVLCEDYRLNRRGALPGRPR